MLEWISNWKDSKATQLEKYQFMEKRNHKGTMVIVLK